MVSLKDYGGFSMEAVEEEKKRLDEGADSGVFLSLDPETSVVMRILPGPPGSKSPLVMFWKHSYTDPLTNKFVAFACPKMQKNEPCPICDEAAALRARGRANKADGDLGFDMMAKKRVLANVFVRCVIDKSGEETPLNEVRVWEFGSGNKGKSMHEKLLAIRGNKRAGGDFVDPIKGFDFVYERRGKGGRYDTTYELTAERDRRPLAEDEADALKILGGMHELSWYTNPPTPDELKKILAGEAETPRGGNAQGKRQQAIPEKSGSKPPDRRGSSGRTATDYLEGGSEYQYGDKGQESDPGYDPDDEPNF